MFTEYFARNQNNLQHQLESSKDNQEIYEHISSFLREMQRECASRLKSDKEREASLILCEIADNATSFLQADSNVKILYENRNPLSRPKLWHYIGTAVSLGLAMYFVVSKQFTVSAICGALSLFQVIVLQNIRLNSIAEPEIKTHVKAKANQIINQLSSLVRLMDARITNLFRNVIQPVQKPQLSKDSLEIIQQLWLEEKKGGSNTRGLVRDFLSSLQDKSLQIRTYSKEIDYAFEKLSGENDGETLLPALMNDNNVFIRGVFIQNKKS